MPPSDDLPSRSAEQMMQFARRDKRRTMQSIPSGNTVAGDNNNNNNACHDDDCGCGREEDLVPPWMEWVEDGIEFFGCEPKGKSVFGRALTQRQQVQEPTEDDRDFAKLHEEFLESLLKEQVVKAGSIALTRAQTNESSSTNTSGGSGLSSTSSLSEITSGSESLRTLSSFSSTKTHKRRRPLKLHKRSPKSPRRKHNARIAPIDMYNKKYNPANANSISLEDIALKDLKNPPEFLHSKCVLQKDKGKGNPLGSVVSAEGREACLDKIREKMSIVVQVSGEERQVSSDMKRRTAVVSAHTDSYIETRSIIELRLGFLSMQYGLLLRWDYKRTGKILFMVLRKMCHDSFYTKVPDILHQEAKTTIITRKNHKEAPPLVVRNVTGNHAIYQRMQGTEVVLVDQPYRVDPPSTPSSLTVAIKSIRGLSKKSRWTISMAFHGHTEVSNLHYNPENKKFEPKNPVMKWDTSLPLTSFDMACLEIRLYKESLSKLTSRRLVTTMTLPLGGLVVQPSTSKATSWEVSMPFTHDPKAKLTISLSHQSDYSHWLYKELQARRSEEVSGLVWKGKSFSRGQSDDQDEDMWEWLCGICFKEYYLFD